MRRLKRPVLLGVAAAILLSAVSWVLVNTLLQLAPVGREVLEAASVPGRGHAILG